MLELYHSGLTTCSKQVRQCLREKNIPYVSRWIELFRSENLSPAYRTLNPNGLVPTLVHDGVPIINSLCINEYIEDVFPQRPLRPSDPIRRARMRYWTWTADDMHIATRRVTRQNTQLGPMGGLSKEDVATLLAAVPVPENRYRWKRVVEGGYSEEEIEVALDSLGHCLDGMELDLGHGGDFLVAGDDISLADISMLAIVHRIHELYPEMLDRSKLPRVTAWHDRMKARPAVAFVYNRDPVEAPVRARPVRTIDGIKEFRVAS